MKAHSVHICDLRLSEGERAMWAACIWLCCALQWCYDNQRVKSYAYQYMYFYRRVTRNMNPALLGIFFCEPLSLQLVIFLRCLGLRLSTATSVSLCPCKRHGKRKPLADPKGTDAKPRLSFDGFNQWNSSVMWMLVYWPVTQNHTKSSRGTQQLSEAVFYFFKLFFKSLKQMHELILYRQHVVRADLVHTLQPKQNAWLVSKRRPSIAGWVCVT